MEQSSVSGIKKNETGEPMCETALTDGTTGDSSGKDCTSKGDNMGSSSTSVIIPKNTSISGMNTAHIGNNQCPTRRSDSVIQQRTIADCETEDSGTIMDIEVQHFRSNTTQDSTSLDIQEHNRIGARQHGNIEHQSISWGKSVQTSTICDSEVQTGPGNDMAIQTNVQCHSEVQTGPSEDISVQTSTTDEHSVQTNTDKVVAVQTSTRDDSEAQTDTNIDIGVQTSTHTDRNTQASIGNSMATHANSEVDGRTRGDSSVNIGTREDTVVQTRDHTMLASLRRNSVTGERRTISDRQRQTGAINDQTRETSENMALERRTSSVTEVHRRSRGDSNLEMVTSEDVRVQPRILVDTSQGQLGVTDDFGVPHEPLGIQDDTRSIPRQSGIIVNIGENLSASRRHTSSPRAHSRSSSPFEVVRRSSGTNEDTNTNTAMDINRLRRVSEDMSEEAGTSREFSSIQVGVQINRAESSGERRECGLLTLQGTPCRRRVSSGRCYIHKK